MPISTASPIKDEEKELLEIFSLLNKLKMSVNNRDVMFTKYFVRDISKKQVKLQTFHERVVWYVKRLNLDKKDTSKLEGILAKVNIFASNILRELSPTAGQLPNLITNPNLINKEANEWQLIGNYVKRLEMDLRSWEALEKEFKEVEKELGY